VVLSSALVGPRKFLFRLSLLPAGRTETEDDELLARNGASRRHVDVGQGLAGEADHGAALEAEKVRMIAGASGLVGAVGAETPGTVRSLDAVDESGPFQGGESPVEGHPVKAFAEAFLNLAVREGAASFVEELQGCQAGFGGPEPDLFQVPFFRHGLAAKAQSG
jgi:hypothetical protein